MLKRFKIEAFINQCWYSSRLVLWPLWPLSFLYCLFVQLRRYLYQKLYQFCPTLFFLPNIPVIVVGNITVGGTGKTPLVIYLARYLLAQGYTPGIISRGYKSQHKIPTEVIEQSDPLRVGDEALLLKKSLENIPVVVFKNRPKALAHLLQRYPNCNVILSDDGLQHYALKRDIEIAVIDGDRQMGNGYCLPAGPLREPLNRLNSVDFVVYNGNPKRYSMRYEPLSLYSLLNPMESLPLAAFKGKTVHAVTGIGNPQRFFNVLEESGITVIKHAFPDHYLFSGNDIDFTDGNPVILTEKDAVKCCRFAQKAHWVLPIKAVMDPVFDTAFLTLLKGKSYG